MLILSLDSTAKTASASLSDNETYLCGVTLNIGNKHSTTLLPAAKFVLEQAGVSVNDVDLFALAAGPGSFTGVRIGAATVKGLSLGRNVPCIGVSSLEVMAEGVSFVDGIVCPMINARRDRHFTAYFSAEQGNIRRLTEDDTVGNEKISEFIAAQERSVYLLGDGAEMFLAAYPDTSAILVSEAVRYPMAYYAGVIAKRIYDRASDDERAGYTSESLRPEYLRQPQAERELQERINNKI